MTLPHRYRELAACRLPVAAIEALAQIAPGALVHTAVVPPALLIEALGNLGAPAASALAAVHLDEQAAVRLLASGERREGVLEILVRRAEIPAQWQERLLNEGTNIHLLADRPWLTDESLLKVAHYCDPSFLLAEITNRADRLDGETAWRVLERTIAEVWDNLGASVRVSFLARARGDLAARMVSVPAFQLPLARVVVDPELTIKLIERLLQRLGQEPARVAAAVLIGRDEIDAELRETLYAGLRREHAELCGVWQLLPPSSEPVGLRGRLLPAYDPFARTAELLARTTEPIGIGEELVLGWALTELSRALQTRSPGTGDLYRQALGTLVERYPELPAELGVSFRTDSRPQRAKQDSSRNEPVVRPSPLPFGGALLADLDTLAPHHTAHAWEAAAAYLSERLDGPNASITWLMVWRLLPQFPGRVDELASTVLASIAT